MIALLLIALASQAAVPPVAAPETSSIIQDAAHAVRVGRLDEARLMVARAVASGAEGPRIERLLADLAFASGNYGEALSRYQRVRAGAPNDASVCEQAGIAALKIGQLSAAATMLDCATAAPAASWRSWNARGVLADLNRDWATADEAYDRAERMFPGEPDVINNRGWSHLLRGDWVRAASYLERAAALDPKSSRIANNRELAQTALESDLPKRRAGETDDSWAARLNDAGVAAQLLGDRRRAVAAFTQALDASGSWYARAANNLQAASSP